MRFIAKALLSITNTESEPVSKRLIKKTKNRTVVIFGHKLEESHHAL